MKTTNKIPESLAKRFAAIVRWDGVLEMAARYDECIDWMRKHKKAIKQELYTLHFAEKCDGGTVQIGIPASFVL